MKNWKTFLPWLLIVILLVFHGSRVSSKDNTIAELRTELVKQHDMQEVAQNLYEGLALETTNLIVESDSLKYLLSETNRDLKYHTSLNLEYKAQIDSIQTYKAVKDTLHYNSTVIVVDSTDRTFKHRYNGNLYLEGFFNTVAPYQLYLNKVELDAKVEVAVSEARDGSWYWDVHTNSKLLTPKSVEIQVSPYSDPWEYFYGADIISKSLNILAPKGVGLHAGVKKGDYSGRLDIRAVEQDGTYVGLGFTKYVRF